MNRLSALLSIIIAAACLQNLGACTAEPTDDQSPELQSDEPALTEFFDEIFEREVDRSPIRQSMLGRKTDRLDEWDDISDAFASETIDQTKADLDALRSRFDYDMLAAEDRLSFDLFVFNANRRINNHEFRRQHYVVDQFNGQLSGLLTVLQNNHDIADMRDAENYVARIAGLGAVLEEMAAQLKDRQQFGVIAPAFSFEDVIADATSMASGQPIDDGPQTNVLFADFSGKIGKLETDAAKREDLLNGATAALSGPYKRGFTALIAEIERLRTLADGDKGVWSLPDGAAYYENRIAHHTTLTLSPEQIHEIGLSEVARIHDEMRLIMQQVGFEGSLTEFFDFIRDDPNNYYADSDAGRERFLDDARELIDEIYGVVGDWFHSVPEAELEVRRVEPWRENSTSIAFYNRPSEDGSRPGIYYANLADMNAVQKYVFTAITYHESVPGHHFQIATAQELTGLPRFRKFAGYGAFTEGWALYAEQLAWEMGFYKNPYHNFGRLQNELWRSVRLVLDTGIHSERWTRQQSIDYFLENTPLSEGDIVTEVERFFVNPGQALGYKLGMMKILELREKAKASLGEAFDIRDFHRAVIGAGSLPLPLLEQQVDAYVTAKRMN